MSRTRNLTVAVAAALAALPAAAQVRTQEADSLETVIVTGTRVTDRTVAESAAPIDIITPEALEATGTGELATALSRVLPSLNFPRPAISDGTDAVKPAQLRGLAPDQVLVLVNGKRRHTTALINLNDSQGRGSSPVDLNAIPIASIARVEVLRDGASAQYGSDAIAGVVNIVLKGSGSGGGITARYGQHSAGDGRQYQLSGDAGFEFGERGFLHLAGQGGHNDQTDRARPYIGTPGPAAPPYDRVVQRYGDPEIDQGAVSFNSEFGFGEHATLYAFGAASNRDVVSNGFFRPAGDSRNIPSIYPNGFLPTINNVAKDRSTVAGLRGGLGNDWNYDLSYNYGYNNLGFDIRNTLNRSLGSTSPRQFYAGSLEVTQNVANLDFSKPIEARWLKYPITFAFGAEWREEKFNQSPGELGSYVDGDGPVNTPPGAQVFPGFKPEDAGHRDRNSSSLYADLEADLTDRFSAAVAARHEDYSDFGTTTSGKVSGRYAFTDAVALRGTVSSGFRAPSLQQQYFQSTATNFIGGVPFDVRTFAVDNSTAIALGAEPLKAEESMNYGLGLVLSPLDGLYVTVDTYRIDIDDRIILSENLIGPTVTAFLETRGIFGVTGGRYFTNAVDTKTTGVDIVGTYKWVLSSSEVDWTIGYNYSKTTIEKIAPNPPELTAGGLNLQRIGRVEQGRITVGAPRDKILLGSVWKSGDWTFSGTATRYGEFSALNANPALDQTFGAKWTVDLAAAYQLDAWSFALGADNIFDAYPDEFYFATSNGGQLVYPRNAPFGFNGAFVYGKVGYRWE
ncbi:TonB-dependent receptor [Tahibacter sp.]|uniref:TonB-dependent receptor plug domain-containing protein n=1 Tax=Tahibacter sp. TaxID=2056211 RepID=UPI0028C45566|nr:TonB-dependent receptor [Tahibacter sp.]